MNKRKNFKEEFETFNKSDKTITDYMKLFYVLVYVLKPADGILWSDIRESLEEVLTKK